MKSHILLFLLQILLLRSVLGSSNNNASNLGLQLSPSSDLLSKDPFEDAEFVKGVQIRGNTRLNSSLNTVRDRTGTTTNFNMRQTAGVNLRGRISRTLNFGFNVRFNSRFLGFQDNFDDAENQLINGGVGTGAGGGSVALQERTPIGSFSFGLEAGISYYAGVLTYSGTRANLRNSNFRSAPVLVNTAQGFSIYERQFNSSGLSSQPEVVVNGISSPFRAKGLKLNYLSNGGSGVNSVSFVGITTSNRRLQRRQVFSTTFFNRTYKLFNVNVFGNRAKYEIGLSNQWITGVDNLVNGESIDYYVHSVTLGRRTAQNGRTLSAEPFQPEYEIAFMRSVLPTVGNTSQKHTMVAKGIILKHAFSGSLIGVNPLLVRLNMYHIDSGYVNPNGGFWRTTPISLMFDPSNNPRTLRRTQLRGSADRILPIDGVANNRQGINFQYGFDFYNIFGRDAIRITGGNEVSRQLTRPTSSVILNPNGVGIVRTDRDLTGRPIGRLHFSSFECDAKYLGVVKGKKLYIQSYLLSYTAKTDFHWVPDFSNASLVRSMRVNTSFYYHLIEGFVPNFNFGYTRVRGNVNTLLNTRGNSDALPTFSATDVITKNFGTGVNIHLNRDYLLALRYNYSSSKNLSLSKSERKVSTVSFNLVYNFRAT